MVILWQVALEETPEGEPDGDQESKERNLQHSNLLSWISIPTDCILAKERTHNWNEWVDNSTLEAQDWKK